MECPYLNSSVNICVCQVPYILGIKFPNKDHNLKSLTLWDQPNDPMWFYFNDIQDYDLMISQNRFCLGYEDINIIRSVENPYLVRKTCVFVWFVSARIRI